MAATTAIRRTVQLSGEELVYLLHLASTSNVLARERLLLPADDQETWRAGRSALAAHGGVTVEHGTVRPTTESGILATILANARRWVEIGVSSGGRTDLFHVVEGADAVIIVSRRALGVVEFAAVRPDTSLEQAILRVLAPLAASPEVSLIIVNALGFDNGPGAVAASRLDNLWRIARRDEGPPLAAGAVTHLIRSAEPEPGWETVGSGAAADLLSWISLLVGPTSSGEIS